MLLDVKCMKQNHELIERYEIYEGVELLCEPQFH